MAKLKKLHDADAPSKQRGPAPDRGGGPAREANGSSRAETEFGACSVCGSALAANGHCPDCGAPGEEPEGLDDYAFSEAESSRAASSHCAPAAQTPAGEGRVGPASAIAEPSVPRMTVADRWAEGGGPSSWPDARAGAGFDGHHPHGVRRPGRSPPAAIGLAPAGGRPSRA